MTGSLRTDRLLMRRWTDADRGPFAALNADPRVMEHFPAVLSREASDALVDRFERSFAERGFGPWVVEVAATGEVIGFTGLAVPGFEAPWMVGRPRPVVEVGWRLAHHAWGHGYASEAARAALEVGFDVLGLPEVVSFTTVRNERSQAVMRRLGMSPLTTYEHPVADGSTLPSVAFVLSAPDWRGRSRPGTP